MTETHSSNNARVCFLFLPLLHISPQVFPEWKRICGTFRKSVPEWKRVCGTFRKSVSEWNRICGTFRKSVPERNHVCGTFRKSFPSGITFAEPSASRSRAESHLRNLPQTCHFLIFGLRIMFLSMC